VTEPPGGSLQEQAGRLADRIAASVAGCPAVAGLADGPVGTYLAGRVITGVAVRGDAAEVAVVARYGLPLADVSAQVRAAVAAVAPGMRVDVRIDDIDAPGPGPGPGAGGAR
jgi:hypothetical protein